jgi:hypothetical protein
MHASRIMTVTKHDAEHIAALVHALRPEWDTRGIIAALHPCAKRPLADTVLAAVRAACDNGARTPGVIPTDGPHWAEKITPRDQGPLVTAYRCRDCGGLHTVDSPCQPITETDISTGLKLARYELQRARAQCCSHGVPFGNCREDHDDATREPLPLDDPAVRWPQEPELEQP